MLPDIAAGRSIETEDALVAGGGGNGVVAGLANQRRAGFAIEQKKASPDDCGTRIAAMDARAPADGRSIGRKFFNDSVFAPDAVALGTHPLRPVVSEGGAEQAGAGERQNDAKAMGPPGAQFGAINEAGHACQHRPIDVVVKPYRLGALASRRRVFS